MTLTATAAEATGLGAAGVLVATGLVLLTLLALAPWAGRRARRVVGGRRLAEILTSAAPVRAEPAGVPEVLLQARVRLVSAALRQAGSGHWGVLELHHAARTDPVVRRLACADLLLCQAVDCLERYFDDLAKDWP